MTISTGNAVAKPIYHHVCGSRSDPVFRTTTTVLPGRVPDELDEPILMGWFCVHCGVLIPPIAGETQLKMEVKP